MKRLMLITALLALQNIPTLADKNLNQAAEHCGVTNWNKLTKRQRACIDKRTAWYLARQDRFVPSKGKVPERLQ